MPTIGEARAPATRRAVQPRRRRRRRRRSPRPASTQTRPAGPRCRRSARQAECAAEPRLGSAEGVDAPSGGDEPVPACGLIDRYPDDSPVGALTTDASRGTALAERVHRTVGRHHEVTPCRSGSLRCHDRGPRRQRPAVPPATAQVPVPPGVPERVDRAVRRGGASSRAPPGVDAIDTTGEGATVSFMPPQYERLPKSKTRRLAGGEAIARCHGLAERRAPSSAAPSNGSGTPVRSAFALHSGHAGGL